MQIDKLHFYKKITVKEAEALSSSGIRFTTKDTSEGTIAQFNKSDMAAVNQLLPKTSGIVL